MTPLEEIARLKKQVEDLTTRRAEARGALEQNQKRLKKEFGCNSIEEAEALLEKKRSERDQLSKKIEVELKKFKKEFGDRLT